MTHISLWDARTERQTNLWNVNVGDDLFTTFRLIASRDGVQRELIISGQARVTEANDDKFGRPDKEPRAVSMRFVKEYKRQVKDYE